MYSNSQRGAVNSRPGFGETQRVPDATAAETPSSNALYATSACFPETPAASLIKSMAHALPSALGGLVANPRVPWEARATRTRRAENICFLCASLLALCRENKDDCF
jgi:hypothetical protein